jgi:hypothetical protein
MKFPVRRNPFESVIDTDFGRYKDHIKALEKDPSVIVRAIAFEEFGKISQAEVQEMAKTGKQLINELRTDYQIAIPEVDYIIGHDNALKKQALYTVTERIEGVKIDNLLRGMSEETRKKLTPQFDQFFYSLFKYLADRYLNNKQYLRDIFMFKQYIYGHRKNENDDEIYLVDVDPLTSRCNGRGLRNRVNLDYYAYVAAVLPFYLSRAETFLGTKLERPRAKLMELLELICEKEGGFEELKQEDSHGRESNFTRIESMKNDLKRGTLLYTFIK